MASRSSKVAKIMATSPGQQQEEVNLVDEEEQDPLAKKRKLEVNIKDILP